MPGLVILHDEFHACAYIQEENPDRKKSLLPSLCMAARASDTGRWRELQGFCRLFYKFPSVLETVS